MALLLKNVLLLTVLLAQLLAPLVHAHVGGEVAGGSVHMPGLEGWGISKEAAYANVTAPWRCCDSGVFVGLAEGMEHQALPQAEPAAAQAAGSPEILLIAGRVGAVGPPSRHAPRLPRLSPFPPRAPPAAA